MKKLLLILMLMLSVVSFGEWKTGDFVDDFGDPTGEKYISFITDGSTNNSAIQNGKAKIKILISDEGDVRISSRSYNWSNTPEKDQSIGSLLKTDKGDIIKYFYLDYNGWMFDERKFQNKLNDTDMINLLKKHKTLKVKIKYKYDKEYNFVIDCNGFTKAYNKILK